MAKFYWLRKRWAARIRANVSFIFGVALPSLLMAIAVVWYMGGFRDFSPWGLPTTTPGAPSSPTAECLIKGNIEDSGERIYHLPGGYYYQFTVIDPAKGERWFCTEADAVAAGWRRSSL